MSWPHLPSFSNDCTLNLLYMRLIASETVKWLNRISVISIWTTIHHPVTLLPVIDSVMEDPALRQTSYHVAQLLMKWGQVGDGRHIEEISAWQPLISQSLPSEFVWARVRECIRPGSLEHLMYLPLEMSFVHCQKGHWAEFRSQKNNSGGPDSRFFHL